MADKLREILLGKPKKPPTTGAKIKASVSGVAKSAQLKGVGLGGKLAEFKAPSAGVPPTSAKWKIGITKGAGIKPNASTGQVGRGRKSRAGFRVQVKF